MTSSARCYCGQVHLRTPAEPLIVAYCHCCDCRRWTSAPLPAFAAFDSDAVTLSRTVEEREHSEGVFRRHCPNCGSALTARFSYLPGQTYVPLGIFDNAEAFAPSLHCHADRALSWLHVQDDLPREIGTAQDRLNAAT